MRFISKMLIVSMACSMLVGCDSMNKQGKGTVIGGAAGALIGSRFGKGGGAIAATGVGALLGALVGSKVGKDLDDRDKEIADLKAKQAFEYSASGTTVEWRNPDSGNSGYITPVNTFKQRDGRYCREYTHAIVVAGKEEKAYGTACRQPDGSWQIVK